jgi:hypothetical protein
MGKEEFRELLEGEVREFLAHVDPDVNQVGPGTYQGNSFQGFFLAGTWWAGTNPNDATQVCAHKVQYGATGAQGTQVTNPTKPCPGKVVQWTIVVSKR